MRRLAPLAALALVAVLVAVPAAAQDMLVTTDVVIPMSDGGELRADLYQPAVDGVTVEPLPTVVIKLAYNKDDPARRERATSGDSSRRRLRRAPGRRPRHRRLAGHVRLPRGREDQSTATRPSSGPRASRGATATSGCGATPSPG